MSAAGAGAVTAVALVASVATGALATSSLEIANESQAEVIVRMPALGQFASFGVRVPAGTTGVVWHDLATRVEEPLFVFDRRCAPLGTATLPLSGGSLVIAGDGTGRTLSSGRGRGTRPRPPTVSPPCRRHRS